MADIDIVPKRRTSTWLWVAIVLIVLAVLFFWLMGTSPVDVNGFLPDLPGTPPAVQAPVTSAA